MKRLKRQWGMMLGILSLVGTAGAAPPANDNFANAINLGGAASVDTSGDNTEATLEPGETDAPFGNRTGTVWYRWTAPASGWVQVDTLGSGLDTIAAVGTGTSIGNYAELAHNDEVLDELRPPTFNNESLLLFQAQAGTVYRIAVGGWNDTEGPFSLHILPSAGPVANVLSSTLTPENVNVTDAAAEITFTITAQSPREIVSAATNYYRENGDCVTGVGLGIFDLKSGTTRNGTWEGTVDIPRYLAPGNYTIGLHVIGAFGETFGSYGSSYDAFLPFPPGATQTITVVNTGTVDSTPPEITAFSSSPASVDVTSAPATVTCAFTVTDELIGLRAMNVFIRDAADSSVTGRHVFPSMGLGGLLSGNAQEGNYSLALEVPQDTAPGTYYFSTYGDDKGSNTTTRSSVPGGGNSEGPLVGNPTFTVINHNFVGSPFDQWATGNGLVPPLNKEKDIPFKDGVENLLKYAFNMDGSRPDHHVLVAGSGASGLPTVYPSAGGVTIEYVAQGGENADDDLVYAVETSTSGGAFMPTASPGTPTPINGQWNRVRLEIPIPPGQTVLARLSIGYGL